MYQSWNVINVIAKRKICSPHSRYSAQECSKKWETMIQYWKHIYPVSVAITFMAIDFRRIEQQFEWNLLIVNPSLLDSDHQHCWNWNRIQHINSFWIICGNICGAHRWIGFCLMVERNNFFIAKCQPPLIRISSANVDRKPINLTENIINPFLRKHNRRGQQYWRRQKAHIPKQ